MTRPSVNTRVVLHNHPQQPYGCLGGMVRYAQSISETPVAHAFADLGAFERWSMRQPVKLDLGEQPVIEGCVPAQRSRLWPDDGLNCWEATAHYIGVALALGLPLEIHVFDREFGPSRHVFPAVRPLGDVRPPVPVLLQASLPRPRAQEWWNDVLGVVHLGGSLALTAFGAGALPPALERIEGNELPPWARIYSAGPAPLRPQEPMSAPATARYRDLAPGAAMDAQTQEPVAWAPPPLWAPAGA